MPVAGDWSYDPTTTIGRVRLLIADTDYEQPDFADSEITAALAMAGDSIHRAGALLLRALAANRARLAVSVRRGNVSEDLSAIARELREQADALDAMAEADIGPMEAVITPSYERFSAERNILLEREDDVLEAP